MSVWFPKCVLTQSPFEIKPNANIKKAKEWRKGCLKSVKMLLNFLKDLFKFDMQRGTLKETFLQQQGLQIDLFQIKANFIS